jgi:hypothetical protein
MGEIREPDNSTVDDWIGQRVDRDTKRAEELLEETGDPEEAEAAWDEQAEKHRPEDLPTEERPARGGSS